VVADTAEGVRDGATGDGVLLGTGVLVGGGVFVEVGSLVAIDALVRIGGIVGRSVSVRVTDVDVIAWIFELHDESVTEHRMIINRIFDDIIILV